METRGRRLVRRGLGGLGAGAAALTVSACALLPGAEQGCTALGPPEGFSVDLDAATPDLGEGERVAEVCLPAQAVCASRTLSRERHAVVRSGVVDLDGDPVTVVVTVRDTEGDVVLDLGTTAIPELNQPKGPGCDAGSYRLDLRVGADGELEPQP